MHAKSQTLQSFKNVLDKICFVEYEMIHFTSIYIMCFSCRIKVEVDIVLNLLVFGICTVGCLVYVKAEHEWHILVFNVTGRGDSGDTSLSLSLSLSVSNHWTTLVLSRGPTVTVGWLIEYSKLFYQFVLFVIATKQRVV